MPTTPEPSPTQNRHRVTASIEPCRVCGAMVDAVKDPEKAQPWSIRCPNADSQSHCGQEGTTYSKTKPGAIGAWNRRQRGGTENMCKPHVTEKNDVDSRVFCKRCKLSEPHECLHADGWARRGESDAAATGLRGRG